VTRDALLERYEKHLIARGLKRRSIDQYVPVARRFLAHVGARGRTQFTSEEYERYLVHRGRTLTTQSVACEVYRLRPFFRALCTLELARRDPSVRLKPRLVEPGPPLVLSEAKVARILAASLRVPKQRGGRPVGLRDRAMLELAYGLGLRVAELAAVRLGDLDTRAGTLLVRRAKNGGQQVLPVPPATLRRVLDYVHQGRPMLLARSKRRDRGALLLNNRGDPISTQMIIIFVRAIAKRAGVWFHAHALRRAIATHLTKGGVSLPAVQKLLGHACLTTTQVYVAVAQEDLRATVALLER
jgi:integrase/recombinase XerD